MPPERRVVVVGAGLAGSAAALALAARGCAVTVVERRAPLAEPMPDARALVLSAASRAVLETLGLWPRLAPHVTAIEAIHVAERGAFGSVRLDAGETGVAALGWACPADLMLREFHAALLATPAITLRWGCRFERAVRHAARIDIHLDGERGAVLEADLLVGADGAASRVRDDAGIALETCDYEQQAVVANIEVARPRAGLAFEYFTAAGPLAMIPQGGARYVSVQCLDEDSVQAAMALDDAAYGALLERRFGRRLGAITVTGPRRAHALRRQRATPLYAARTVLVGNAANTVHPNAAQGLNLGLRDVATLARELDCAADPGADSVLAAYAAARAGDHRFTGVFTHLLAQGFTTSLPPARCLRRGALALLATVAPLRQRLVRRLGGHAPAGGTR